MRKYNRDCNTKISFIWKKILIKISFQGRLCKFGFYLFTNKIEVWKKLRSYDHYVNNEVLKKKQILRLKALKGNWGYKNLKKKIKVLHDMSFP